MLKRGVISYFEGGRAAVFFPDESNAVTPPIPLANNITSVNVGDNCVVALFDADVINFADAVIIAVF